MMLPRVESPAPDETFASWIGRHLDQVPRASVLRIRCALTGSEFGAFVHDFPIRVAFVADVLGRCIQLTAEEILAQTTLLPLYAPFLTPERYARVREAMLQGESGSPATMLGLHRCGATRRRVLCFCDDCREREIKARGYAWWHRALQVAGVEVCPMDAKPVFTSQLRQRAEWKVACASISDASSVSSFAGSAVSPVLAKDVQELLLANLGPTSVEQLRGAYFELMRERGYVVGDRLKRADLLHDFLAATPAATLAGHCVAYDPRSPYSWPAKIALGQGDCHPPLRHLHLIRFLGSSAVAFVHLMRGHRGRPRPRRTLGDAKIDELSRMWADPTISLTGIARQLGVAEQTVRTWGSAIGLPLPRPGFKSEAFEKRREKMRDEWLNLAGRKPSKRRTRVLKWLSRNDHRWFAENKHKGVRGLHPVVDWQARDRALANLVPVAAESLKSQRPFRRVTRSGLAESLFLDNVVAAAKGRMPSYSSNVVKSVETWREFAVRRAKVVRRQNPEAPTWRVLEAATTPRNLRNDPEIRAAIR